MNTRDRKTSALLLALALPASLGAAQSQGSWQPGSGVRVGGVYFHVVSVASDSEALFRVSRRLEAPGVPEHPDCYRVGRTFYHQESCPVVQEFFRRHAAEASSAAPTMAPASRSGGSHPINYLQGSYRQPAAPIWRSTGLWYAPWFGYGYRSGGGRAFTRPGFGPGHRPGLRPPARGFGSRAFYGGGALYFRW